MKHIVAFSQEHPRLTAWLGTVAGWASVDWLRISQFVAAVLAALVSLCALVLTGPQALAKVRSWLGR